MVAEQGCRFASPDDPDAASLGISQDELAALGGIDGSKAGISSVVEGDVEDVPGVGDAAFVVIGPTFGGSTLTGGGGVALGSSLVQITVIPGPDATDDDVRRATVERAHPDRGEGGVTPVRTLTVATVVLAAGVVGGVAGPVERRGPGRQADRRHLLLGVPGRQLVAR